MIKTKACVSRLLKNNSHFVVLFVLLTLLMGMWALVYWCWCISELERKLSYVPVAMGIKTVRYSNEESYGFGPGGNETGVIVYDLPNEASEKIKEFDIEYFNLISKEPRTSNGWEGVFTNWYKTPVVLNDLWKGPKMAGEYIQKIDNPKISIFLDNYGFGIPIDKDIEANIDDGIRGNEGYYSYGRVGVLIIFPAKKIVVFAYSG